MGKETATKVTLNPLLVQVRRPMGNTPAISTEALDQSYVELVRALKRQAETPFAEFSARDVAVAVGHLFNQARALRAALDEAERDAKRWAKYALVMDATMNISDAATPQPGGEQK